MFQQLIMGLEYLFLILFIMLSAGLIKEKNLFASIFSLIKNTFKSNRIVVFLISLVGGVLPIEGRVTVSAGLLDTVACKKKQYRRKFGVVDYLATHHYYLWSPLEKTVILPMAILGLSYGKWLSIIWPLLVVSLVFIFSYIFFTVKEEELEIATVDFKIKDFFKNMLPFLLALFSYIAGYNVIVTFGILTLYYIFITKEYSIKKLISLIKWDVLVIVAIIIMLGNYIKLNDKLIKDFVTSFVVGPEHIFGFALLSVVAFLASFVLGSSSKFIAMAILLTQLVGFEYFLWFFSIQYAGYLLSPTHKCVAIGNRYFGTPLKYYYGVIGIWSLILIATGFVFTFL